MFTLYDGTVSVCAIKVRLVLAEKGLDYESRTLDLRKGEHLLDGYLKLNPNGVVPTLVHDGEVIIESSVIMQYLEDLQPDPALLPPGAIDRARLRLWLKRIDDPVHPACGVLTHATAFRAYFLALTPAQQEARMAKLPDPGRRARQRAVYKDGLDAAIVVDAAKTFDKMIGDMEAALARSPWLAGDTYTLADAAATPYVARLEMLGLLEIWTGSHPRLDDWYARIRARPSFDAAVTDYFTAADAGHFAGVDTGAADRLRKILAAA